LRHGEGIGIDSARECMAKKRLPVVKDHPRLIIVNAARDAQTTFLSPRASFHAYLFCKKLRQLVKLAATLQRKIDHRTAAITSTVTTSKSGVSSIVLSWPKRRTAAPTNAKASLAANFQCGLKLGLRRSAVACVTPFLQPPSRATGATLPKPRWLPRPAQPFRRAQFLLLRHHSQPPTIRRSPDLQAQS
jgi:hypothetical protein